MVEVELRPGRVAKLARLDESQGGEPQCVGCCGVAAVAVNGAEQLSDPRGVGDGGMIRGHERGERATQVRRDVVYGPAGCDGVAEYLATALLGPMRGLVGAADFDLAQDSEKVRRSNLANRSLPQSGEDEGLESPAGFGECGRRQLGFLQGQPFASDGLEVISLGSLLGLALRGLLQLPATAEPLR